MKKDGNARLEFATATHDSAAMQPPHPGEQLTVFDTAQGISGRGNNSGRHSWTKWLAGLIYCVEAV